MQIKVRDKDVLKVLKKLPSEMRAKAIIPAILKGGSFLRDKAKTNVSAASTAGYSTGELEKSLTYYRMKNYQSYYRVGISVAKGAVNRKKIVNGSPVRIGLYAAVLEYGKKNQRPQSWIRRTARENPSNALDVVREEISNNLGKAVESAKK